MVFQSMQNAVDWVHVAASGILGMPTLLYEPMP